MADTGFRHTQQAFTAYLRNPARQAPPEDVAPERIGLYRELFLNNVLSALESGFPVLNQTLESESWQALAEDFFARHRSRTPYFYGIPEEFLRYLHDEREGQVDDPPYLLELAHYEWVELALAIATDDAPEERPELAENPLNAVIALSPVAWPLAYRFPVQRIGRDYRPQQPPAVSTCLAVYRDRSDRVHFLELAPLTYRLLQLLQEQGPLPSADCFARLADEAGLSDPHALLEHGQGLLRDLHARGVIGLA
ncbi:DUF2063 domain-containing protein [Methylococcus sp. EFPC2]|uniref:HvfC family RiPP maturation protein n=1 Tax=Methylococcus sp. EFPC2 TaxID=2812648 RepID=UPI001966E312|nr:putative DNA-binding domain-containing protein [Methylococcus sp. EFPC2]QSA95977.1 putative DNA-binding domain-containing protein [Methylococcus sp. EFPC2]